MKLFGFNKNKIEISEIDIEGDIQITIDDNENECYVFLNKCQIKMLIKHLQKQLL